MISIIVPSIRTSLQRYVDSIDESLQEEYELIVVSPERRRVVTTPLMTRYKCIIDKGSPSRCLQRGILASSSSIFTWGTDDGVLFPGALKECVSLLRDQFPDYGMCKDGVVIKYTEEGPGTFTGASDAYYVAKYHEANRQPGIDPDWITAPVGMYSKHYWCSIGGFDCRFEHINMNMHDFAYRLQKDGGKLHYSPKVVMHCDSNNWGADHRVLDDAYNRNDLPLFKELYKDDSRQIKIDVCNWEESPAEWRRYTP